MQTSTNKDMKLKQTKQTDLRIDKDGKTSVQPSKQNAGKKRTKPEVKPASRIPSLTKK